jgi:hypothetical protein
MKGFISYAHADYDAYEAFCRAVAPAACGLGVDFWSDQQLHTGQEWNEKIAAAVAEAEVFVALVSLESLWSSYISKQELPAIRTRSNAIGGLILPVLVNQCLWEYQFAAIHAAPINRGRLIPIYDWRPKHNGFVEAARQAAAAIKRYYNLQAGATP